MKLLPLFLTAVLTSAAFAKAPVKFPELKLEDGTVLKDVEVLKVEPDALRVEHSDGLHRIKMENLPEAVQKQFGFDVDKAVEYRVKMEVEKEKAEKAEHDAKVTALLEQRREDQESDVTCGREAFYRLLESDEYSYPKLDQSLMDSIAILKDAGRDDLAAMVEEDRKLLREREIVRPGEKHRKERDQLLSRIRDLENQVAQLSNRPPDVRVIRDVDTVPIFVDRPVVIDRPVVQPVPCPPTRPPVSQPGIVIPGTPVRPAVPSAPIYQPPSLPSTPVVQPTLPTGGAQIHGAHLWKKK